MKLIGSDYDGTLNHGGIDEAKLSAIRRWREAGNLFGVVSGRGPEFLAELTDKLGDKLIFPPPATAVWRWTPPVTLSLIIAVRG